MYSFKITCSYTGISVWRKQNCERLWPRLHIASRIPKSLLTDGFNYLEDSHLKITSNSQISVNNSRSSWVTQNLQVTQTIISWIYVSWKIISANHASQEYTCTTLLQGSLRGFLIFFFIFITLPVEVNQWINQSVNQSVSQSVNLDWNLIGFFVCVSLIKSLLTFITCVN